MTNNNEKGFTLVELMIGMIIAVIILGGVVQLLDSSLRIQTSNMAKINDIQDGQVALNKIAEEIEYAFSNSLHTLNGTDKDSEIYFMRTVGIDGGKETRRIYFNPGTDDKGGNIIIEHGPYPQVTNPWTFTSKTTLATNAVRSITFSISKPDKNSSIDSDIDISKDANNAEAKRKTVTVQLINNSKKNVTDSQKTVIETKVTTKNMQ